MREALSTARPSRLRLAGFLTLAAGGAMLGVGAIASWGTIAFPEEVDPTRAVTAPIPGIDLWEGVLVLAASVVALVGMVALRLVRHPALRRLVAVLITVVAFGAAALAATVALGASTRLVQTEGLDAYARSLSEDLDLPYDQVRRDIEEVFRQDLVVETEPGVWLAVAGGVLAGIGGILSILWVRERERELPPEPEPPRGIFT